MSELFVPSRVDAIRLARAQSVTGPLSDFETLPWFDTARDHSSTTPFLGASINAPPFADHAYWLEAGMHLHWSLPDGLTQGSSRQSPDYPIEVDDLWFPAVPNRWLVYRSDRNGLTDAAWLVESDFVHTELDPLTGEHRPNRFRPNRRAIAYANKHPNEGCPPYLFLGRQIELNPETLRAPDPVATAQAANQLSHYGAPLTAVGHGDPAFATHYPSCRSVFGLYDANPPEGELHYVVYGWYSDQALDPLAAALNSLNANMPAAKALLAQMPEADLGKDIFTQPKKALFDSDWQYARLELLKRRFGWSGFVELASVFPHNLVTYARTRVIGPALVGSPTTQVDLASIGIGANPQEAYAAYLMRHANPDEGRELAGILTHDLGPSDLSHHGLDLSFKQKEARHTEEFRALPGHCIWQVRPREGDGEESASGITLPEEVAADLNQLNVLQERYDTRRSRISSMRQSLFADWSQFMRAVYPDGDTDPFAVNPDDLQETIERTRLAPLEELIAHTGHLYVFEDEAGNQRVSDQDFVSGELVGVQSGESFAEPLNSGETLAGLVLAIQDGLTGIQMVPRVGKRISVGSLDGPREEVWLRTGERIAAVSGLLANLQGRTKLMGIVVETNQGRRIGSTPFAQTRSDATPFRLVLPRGMSMAGFRGSLDDHGISSLALLGADPHLPRHLPLWGRDTIATQIVTEHTALLNRLAESGSEDLILGVTPGPRYWLPNDPVIALGPEMAKASERHGHDGVSTTESEPDESRKRSKGYLSVYSLHLPTWSTDGQILAGNTRAPRGLTGQNIHSNGPSTESNGENWHAMQVEWQAELQPLAEGSNVGSPHYDTRFVTRNHALDADKPDMRETSHVLSPTYQYVSGRSQINPSIGKLMQKRLSKASSDWSSVLMNSPVAPSILPLGGFHEQLLQMLHEPQLPIDDPVGLPGQRAFATRIRHAVGPMHPTSPQPDSPFHPIRSGELIIQRLRIVDSFGRTREWRPDAVQTVPRMYAPSGDPDRALLPVRLSQPARLDFRWLSAADGVSESNAHPASSPVCGWVVANELDREVAFYGASGRLLGSVDIDGLWTRAPGDPLAPRTPRDIASKPIARVVQWLCNQQGLSGNGETEPMTELAPAAELVDAFLDTIEAALFRIDPVQAATHQSRAMFVSRPMALVRARLNLSTQHHLAEDQSLRALRARLQGRAPDSHGVEQVGFPVRLGEHGQLNDSLCGYWLDDEHGLAQETFHTPTGIEANTGHDKIRLLQGGDTDDFPIQLSLGGSAQNVTMLMDPLGVIHATSGILPTKSIALPSDQIRDQLASLRVIFTSAPILTPAADVEVPLPAEPGYSWSWLERDGDDWHETPHHPTVHRDALIAGFGKPGPQLWDRLIDLGRIEVHDHSNQGLLVGADPDAADDRFDDLGLTPEMVERGLHALAQGIERTSHEARLSARVVARDGYLQLRPSPRPNPHAIKSKVPT